MRVLVTGNEGYIGSILVPMLQDAGHEVFGLDVGLFRECALSPIAQPPTMRKDVRDIEARDLRGFDAIVHLAGLANDPLGDLDPPLTFAINHGASVRLAEAARTAGVGRFIFASSCSVYGAAGEDLIDEGTAPNPLTPYGSSKALAETDLARLATPGFSLVFLRAATAYGVSPYLRFDLALNNLVAWACATGLVYLKSDGQAWRPFIHVEDIARAYLAALQSRKTDGQTFNVGATQENYRIRAVAELVHDAVPETRIEYADDAMPDHRSYRVSFEKIAAADIGFAPHWDVAAGVREVYAAVRRHKLGVQDFEGARYSRIAHLRHLLDDGRVDPELRWIGVDSAQLRRIA